MKIIDIAEFYAREGGGVRTYIHQKMEAARAAGHELTIIAPGPETRLEETEHGRIWWARAFQLPMDKRYFLFTKSADVHQILGEEKPDVIEASSTWRGAWIAARWPGKAVRSLILHQEPVSVYPHTLFGNLVNEQRIDAMFSLFWSYLRQLSRRFDTSVVSGDWLANRFASFGMQRPAVIPFGIIKQDFSPSLRDEGLRASLLQAMDLDPNRARLLVNVSRHHPEKRLRTVFSAVQKANAQHPTGVLQIGAGPFGKHVKRWAKGAANINLAGFIQDRAYLARVLASADAMIHGGAAETYGLVMAEGLCSGLPLITPDAGGAFDMAGPGYSEVYRTGDAPAAAQAIERLFSRDQSKLRSNAAQAAEHKISGHEDHFAKLFAHYQDLLTATSYSEGNAAVVPA